MEIEVVKYEAKQYYKIFNEIARVFRKHDIELMQAMGILTKMLAEGAVQQFHEKMDKEFIKHTCEILRDDLQMARLQSKDTTEMNSA